jgi:hypothetical protein
VVRIFRLAGFTTQSDPPKANAPTWYARYSKQGCDLAIWLNFSSTVCRRVKVGTKLVEQEIFETVCGEVDPQNSTEAIEQPSQPLIDDRDGIA